MRHRAGCDNADSISRKVQIEGITTGVVVDYGIKDAMNMGAAMAPAACELIVNHLSDFGREAFILRQDSDRRSWKRRTEDTD